MPSTNTHHESESRTYIVLIVLPLACAALLRPPPTSKWTRPLGEWHNVVKSLVWHTMIWRSLTGYEPMGARNSVWSIRFFRWGRATCDLLFWADVWAYWDRHPVQPRTQGFVLTRSDYCCLRPSKGISDQVILSPAEQAENKLLFFKNVFPLWRAIHILVVSSLMDVCTDSVAKLAGCKNIR